MKKNKGYFVTIEGIEGSGKSTCIKNMRLHFDCYTKGSIVTSEPNGTSFWRDIKKIISNQESDPLTEALVYASARRDHILKLIKPALEEGKLVISDRFVDSSIVYQSSDNLPMDKIIEINKQAIGDYFPDLTFVLLVNPRKAQARLIINDREMDSNDNKPLSFHKKINKKYKKLGKLFPKRIVYINASVKRNESDIVSEIVEEIKKRIEIKAK